MAGLVSFFPLMAAICDHRSVACRLHSCGASLAHSAEAVRQTPHHHPPDVLVKSWPPCCRVLSFTAVASPVWGRRLGEGGGRQAAVLCPSAGVSLPPMFFLWTPLCLGGRLLLITRKQRSPSYPHGILSRDFIVSLDLVTLQFRHSVLLNSPFGVPVGGVVHDDVLLSE